MKPIRLGLIFDFEEERWPSMDLVGEMILSHLRRDHAGEMDATRIRPPFRRRLTRLPALGKRGAAHNADRVWNRFRDYPRWLARSARRGEFDLYHVVDHSYAQVVHALPAGRTVVTCHDLDTFRCLLDPPAEPRPAWFRALVRRTMTGLQKAALVVCVSESTRQALRDAQLVPDDRIAVVPNGISEEYSTEPDPAADSEADRLLLSGPTGVGEAARAPINLLHVGSNIPRKRIDVLLATFAAVRRDRPEARLIKVGGKLTAEQDQLARDLGILDAILFAPFLDRSALAAIYRRADLVLQPSESEGFGLPVAEAMACGAPVLASDIATLREVGGEAAAYRPVGDIEAWSKAVLDLIDNPSGERRASGLRQSSRYRWPAHADRLVELYRGIYPPL